MRWTERDLAVLRWVFEQYVIRLDQLAELAGRWPGKETQSQGGSGRPTVRALVARWRQAGVVESDTLLVRQPLWCWMTTQGQALLGVEARVWNPSTIGGIGAGASLLRQSGAVVAGTNPPRGDLDERAAVAAQGNRRRRKGSQRRRCPMPKCSWADGRIAIEVELTAKTEERWQEVLAERAARYDQVWYFTSTRLHRDLGRALDAVEPGASEILPLAGERSGVPAGAPAAVNESGKEIYTFSKQAPSR